MIQYSEREKVRACCGAKDKTDLKALDRKLNNQVMTNKRGILVLRTGNLVVFKNTITDSNRQTPMDVIHSIYG